MRMKLKTHKLKVCRGEKLIKRQSSRKQKSNQNIIIKPLDYYTSSFAILIRFFSVISHLVRNANREIKKKRSYS